MTTTSSQITSRSFLARAAGAGLLAAGLLVGSASAPALAAETGWKIGCAYKMTSGIPGNGHAIIAEACRHQTECQTMAGQHRPNMMEMGCFGYGAPARRN